jgi:hypothetical protein
MERMRKEVIMACLRHYPSICLEGGLKTMKNLSQWLMSLPPRFNLATSKCKSEVFLFEQTGLDLMHWLCYKLFNNGFSIKTLQHQIGRMTNDWWTWSIWKEAVIDWSYCWTLFCHFPEGTDESHKIPGQDSWCPGQYSNSEPPEHKSIALPPDQLTHCCFLL